MTEKGESMLDLTQGQLEAFTKMVDSGMCEAAALQRLRRERPEGRQAVIDKLLARYEPGGRSGQVVNPAQGQLVDILKQSGMSEGRALREAVRRLRGEADPRLTEGLAKLEDAASAAEQREFAEDLKAARRERRLPESDPSHFEQAQDRVMRERNISRGQAIQWLVHNEQRLYEAYMFGVRNGVGTGQ